MEFRLLAEAPPNHPGPSLDLEGQRWSITDPLDIVSDGTQVPEYTCISYVWGPGRVDNPLSSVRMSDHTLPALRAALRNHPCRLFWQDVFCVPQDRQRKRATLESMGFIYGRATQVVVVLSEASIHAFDAMTRWKESTPDEVTDEVANTLEGDPWIRSVWTYQEVVNSRHLYFVGEGVDNLLVDGTQFLNSFGYFLYRYRKKTNLSAFDTRVQYPFLDSLEDVVLDWKTGDYGERSALQVLSSMNMKVWDDVANYFYSMIGAITTKPSQRTSDPTLETLSDAFMTICEEKGDYSFIFCSNERDTRPGYAWRPARQVLRSALSWHCYGDGQSGERDTSGSLTLKGMALLEQASHLGNDAKEFIGRWMDLEDPMGRSDEDIRERLFNALRKIGFRGDGDAITTTDGFFVPQRRVPLTSDIQLWASTSLVWAMGALAWPSFASPTVKSTYPEYTLVKR
ncbi:hypothetical protein BC834DRAFT_965561 [Gloeopeniophorella convolvens]|nr:hypothetical protein BC834DRAFT_965561 [Gloeopeniophorella convolvens]